MSADVAWPTDWHTNHAPEPPRAATLPRLHPAAYHGILGDIVRTVAPVTEADPVAILTSLLAATGALIGDRPHIWIGGAQHPPRLWPLIVGNTGSGRKGTSWAVTNNILTRIDRYFTNQRIVSGLTSGEGIIAHLADPPVTDDDADQHTVTPPAVDKRLLAVEPEFARVLAVARRDGSVLSHVLRQAWESGDWRVMTRNQPLHCHRGHLAIIGHVTPRELQAKLADSEVAGGFFNRFMPVLAERTRYLPLEPDPPDLDWQQKELGRIVGQARHRDLIRRTPAADDAWQRLYVILEQLVPEHGTIAEITARGPAYLMRIALLYALLDDSDAIDLEHLRAGAALWHYVVATVKEMFGAGDPDLEKVLVALKEAEHRQLNRRNLDRLFSGHRTKAELDDIVARLIGRGDAQAVTEETGGRPIEWLVLVDEVRTDPLIQAIQEMRDQ